MTCFVQTVFPLVALPFGNPLIDLREMEVATRLLLAAVPPGANFISLLGTYQRAPLKPPM